MTDDLAAALAGIRARANQRITAPFDSAAAIDGSIKSAADVPRLLAAVEAVLKLVDEWEDSAAIEYPSGALREAITAALAARETAEGNDG